MFRRVYYWRGGGKDSYPSQLEEILNQRNRGVKFGVINKGMPGTTTSNIILELENNLDRYKPDMVITMMGINDLGKHLPYEGVTASRFKLFFRHLKIYKFVRLFWLHTATKAKEIRIYKSKHNRCSIDTPFLELRLCNSEQKDHFQYKKKFKINKELSSKDAITFVQLGKFYLDQRYYSQAEKNFKKAIKLNPRIIGGYSGLGWVYDSQGDYSKTEKFFKKAVEIDQNPSSTWSFVELGRFYKMRQRYYEAEKIFNSLLKMSQKDVRPYMELLALYKNMGKYESAEEYQKKLNKLLSEYYNPVTCNNYIELKKNLDKRKIRLVCVQYPMRSVKPLKKIFEDQEGMIFVDNEKVFKNALKKTSYEEYFKDRFGGDFGHCTRKGNRLLAKNIAKIILNNVFNERRVLYY